MGNQVLIGYRVFKKNQVRVESGSGPRKTLPEKWSIDTKVRNMCLRQRQIFHGHKISQHFYHVSSFKSINIVFETSKYHSWPNTLPFRVGYWGANTLTLGSDSSTRSSPSLEIKPTCSQGHAAFFVLFRRWKYSILGAPKIYEQHINLINIWWAGLDAT